MHEPCLAATCPYLWSRPLKPSCAIPKYGSPSSHFLKVLLVFVVERLDVDFTFGSPYLFLLQSGFSLTWVGATVATTAFAFFLGKRSVTPEPIAMMAASAGVLFVPLGGCGVCMCMHSYVALWCTNENLVACLQGHCSQKKTRPICSLRVTFTPLLSSVEGFA